MGFQTVVLIERSNELLQRPAITSHGDRRKKISREFPRFLNSFFIGLRQDLKISTEKVRLCLNHFGKKFCEMGD